MGFEPELEPAPENFRSLFNGQALDHFDEIVLSWRTGGHPISWQPAHASFEVFINTGPVPLFQLNSPVDGLPAQIVFDIQSVSSCGIPDDLARRIWEELAFIANVDENPSGPLAVALGKFSRGDRKVFLAYALTVARQLTSYPDTLSST